jgi:LAO/AO transport system kinase
LNADDSTTPDPDFRAGEALGELLLKGERRALAQAITLVESARSDHQRQAEGLLARILPNSGGAVRLGVTGSPGVGKSTFIEAFGLHLADLGKRVAVLAVDPSSVRSGGSILGDKTRMEELSKHPRAFIRPSPSGGTLGGVARRTREAMLICEAAGFDVVIIETVGVGQSETKVAAMVDMFMLLLAPGGGDELQGIKRGIMELADLVVVNKADGKMKEIAGQVAAEYAAALRILRPATPHWTARVVTCSALENTGMIEIWSQVAAHRRAFDAAGQLAHKRWEQTRRWLWSEIEESLGAAFRADSSVTALLGEVENQVRSGGLTPSRAAARLLQAFRAQDGAGAKPGPDRDGGA